MAICLPIIVVKKIKKETKNRIRVMGLEIKLCNCGQKMVQGLEEEKN